ncbi:MAG: hypothetical protein JOZ49_21570 [Mycolicibacterium sp.]|nr:hypothetical protein [Mycolicibacterium sp.]
MHGGLAVGCFDGRGGGAALDGVAGGRGGDAARLSMSRTVQGGLPGRVIGALGELCGARAVLEWASGASRSARLHGNGLGTDEVNFGAATMGCRASARREVAKTGADTGAGTAGAAHGFVRQLWVRGPRMPVDRTGNRAAGLGVSNRVRSDV